MRYIDPPDGRPWALLALCGGSLLLNLALATRLWMLQPAPEALAAVHTDAPAVEAVAEAADEDALAVEAADGEGGVASASVTPAPDLDDGLIRVRAPIQHSLARTFQTAAPDHADVVSAVYARLFVWDLDLRKDLQKGDEIAVAYHWDGELAHIPVASYTSGKLGREIRAYRFQATGDEHPSWWDANGTEIPHRLKNGPLQGDYEQITSLLKDRPSHKGMDFKLPEGTPVMTPKAGTVTRADWNLKYNGNCVEVKFDDGTLARFLHLSDTQVKAGQRLAAGTPVGLTGNTGRSTAPHLHYELEKNGQVVDPVAYHGTIRRQLAPGDLATFEQEVARLDSELDAATSG